QGFAEYAIARRTISLIFPVILLGVPLALPRYIAYNGGDPDSTARYYGAALKCLAVSSVLCVVVMSLFRRAFGYVFFGATRYSHLAFPMSLVIVGLTLHSLVYAYYRGHLQLTGANSLQFINFALVPIVVFSRFAASVHSVLVAWGVGTILISFVALF